MSDRFSTEPPSYSLRDRFMTPLTEPITNKHLGKRMKIYKKKTHFTSGSDDFRWFKIEKSFYIFVVVVIFLVYKNGRENWNSGCIEMSVTSTAPPHPTLLKNIYFKKKKRQIFDSWVILNRLSSYYFSLFSTQWYRAGRLLWDALEFFTCLSRRKNHSNGSYYLEIRRSRVFFFLSGMTTFLVSLEAIRPVSRRITHCFSDKTTRKRKRNWRNINPIIVYIINLISIEYAQLQAFVNNRPQFWKVKITNWQKRMTSTKDLAKDGRQENSNSMAIRQSTMKVNTLQKSVG